MKSTVILLALACCIGCKAPTRSEAPALDASVKPLGAESARDEIFTVTPFVPKGPAVPKLPRLHASLAQIAQGFPKLPQEGALLVDFDDEVYMAALAPFFARVDGRSLWFAHPDAPLAFPVKLRDEPAFQAWLDEATPGKIRVIQRADGFELVTNLGKLPGSDPNGPTIPLRGGQLDLHRLRLGLERLRGRFPDAPDCCFVPSFGMPVADVVRALAAASGGPGDELFQEFCIVYSRPPRR